MFFVRIRYKTLYFYVAKERILLRIRGLFFVLYTIGSGDHKKFSLQILAGSCIFIKCGMYRTDFLHIFEIL